MFSAVLSRGVLSRNGDVLWCAVSSRLDIGSVFLSKKAGPIFLYKRKKKPSSKFSLRARLFRQAILSKQQRTVTQHNYPTFL